MHLHFPALPIFLPQALPAVEYSSDIHQWRAAQMVPDLAMLVLITVYIGLVISDTIATWSIERKSRHQGMPLETSGTSTTAVTSFRTHTSPFMMVFELCLCGLMLGAVATWYFYATSLVQDESFGTKWVRVLSATPVKGQ